MKAKNRAKVEKITKFQSNTKVTRRPLEVPSRLSSKTTIAIKEKKRR
jgi:hypothetical protein